MKRTLVIPELVACRCEFESRLLHASHPLVLFGSSSLRSMWAPRILCSVLCNSGPRTCPGYTGCNEACMIFLSSSTTRLSYSFLRYPAQQKVGGNSKIPTIIDYDARGNVEVIGGEAVNEAFLEKAKDEGYTKVEWFTYCSVVSRSRINNRFKLHLRPKALAASHITDADIPALPLRKTALGILTDSLRYLFAAA
ncbi:hypothetical protein BDZ89DRAFT_7565 [Hymenopellis radicata]|nr:hypothetical protein BDZ89DRAFT_7565 [Hymenopellis radicata]